MKAKYEKPVVQKIRLVPSEAVLQSCKTQQIVGPRGTGCESIEHLACFSLGS